MAQTKVRVDPKLPVTAYTTRNLDRGLLDRLRVIAVMENPQWTLEYTLNEALRIGIEALEEEVGLSAEA